MSPTVRLWWRDDDAEKHTPALDRLLALKRKWSIPLSLAVVPKTADDSLARPVQADDVGVLVHGYAHTNHNANGERKAEFSSRRSPFDMEYELRAALSILRSCIPMTLPVFVPPWNRMPEALALSLPQMGYVGLSAWGAEDKWPKSAGLRIANAHIDVINWRDGARAKTVSELAAELSAASQAHQLIGVLTHHLQMTDAGFEALDGFFRHVSKNPAFAWTEARHIFQPSE